MQIACEDLSETINAAKSLLNEIEKRWHAEILATEPWVLDVAVSLEQELGFAGVERLRLLPARRDANPGDYWALYPQCMQISERLANCLHMMPDGVRRSPSKLSYAVLGGSSTSWRRL